MKLFEPCREEKLGRIGPGPLVEDAVTARAAVESQATALADFALAQAAAESSFVRFEKDVIPRVFSLGRAVLVLFLVASEARVRAALTARVTQGGRTFRPCPPESRSLLSWFGVVRYQRSYLREVAKRGKQTRGFYPVDAALGLLADRLSPHVLAISVRLATRMAFAEAHEELGWFVPSAPSTEVIEKAALGYGRHAPDWFARVSAPLNDGEVLVMQFDSKGVPTATEEELRLRRGKRAQRPKAPSPRHRGRLARGRRTKKPRRKKGDKAKNAKMGTMVVIYTLHREGNLLLGPINKRYYASFGPKRHVFEYARREASRRGFPPDTDRTVQIVTDGDNDLARNAAEFFPRAKHTVDVAHVVEKLWDVASSLHKEGSPEHAQWAEDMKALLYAGKAARIVDELDRHLARIPLTGPGNKYRRQKLSDVREYMAKRLSSMNYRELRKQDLEIGSGQVEGAIKALMYRRMDQGGMRWIKERGQAILQLRCIDANGDWDAFVDWVHEQAQVRAVSSASRVRLQHPHPAPIPSESSAQPLRTAA